MPVGAKDSVKGPCRGHGRRAFLFSTQRQAKGEGLKLLPAGFRLSMKKVSEGDELLEGIRNRDRETDSRDLQGCHGMIILP